MYSSHLPFSSQSVLWLMNVIVSPPSSLLPDYEAALPQAANTNNDAIVKLALPKIVFLPIFKSSSNFSKRSRIHIITFIFKCIYFYL